MSLLNESKLVYEQCLFIFQNQTKFNKIQIIYYPSFNKENTCFGKNVKVNFSNYANEFYRIATEEKTTIVLEDNSIINLNYSFDKEGFIIEHHLSYLPNPMASNVSPQEIESKYIRIDYENLGYAPKIHSNIHFHIGRYKNLRFPCTSIVSPIQFISFILLFYYNTEYSEFSRFLNKDNLRNLLQHDENGIFAINFIKKTP